jgi:hypothetical protein
MQIIYVRFPPNTSSSSVSWCVHSLFLVIWHLFIDIVVLHYDFGLVDDRIPILLGLLIDRLFGLG